MGDPSPRRRYGALRPARFTSLGCALGVLLIAGCGGGRRSSPDASVADAGASDAGAPDATIVVDEDAGLDASVPDAGDASTPPPDAAAPPHIFDEAAANPGVWTWVPIEGATCRDGSPAGLGLRIRPGGPGLILFMHGGGACINGFTCSLNRSSFGEADLAEWASGLGDNHIFNPNNALNPVRDWHAAFISYCTGDFHGGTRTGVDVPGGPTNQSFVGHLNMARMTAHLAEYFTDVEHVLLVGSSAGGFGTTLNYVQVEEAFSPTRVTLLDDSGPVLPNDDAVAPCLQRKMRDLWGLDEALPADCATCFSASGDGLSNLFVYLGRTYPDARFGLLTTTGDAVVRSLYGYGRNDCNPILPGPITAEQYRTGLFSLRSMLPSNWGTYYIGGIMRTLHAMLAFFPVLSVDGVTLPSWISDLVAGDVSHVAPP